MAPWIISLIIISIYCIAVILIGIASRDKGVSTLENYYVGGRSIGPFVSYFTYVATFHSSFAFWVRRGRSIPMVSTSLLYLHPVLLAP